MSGFEEMTKDELVAALRDAQAELQQARSVVENDRVVHDLKVHQIELEMQNRALREAQGALEESRARYADLYDFAPIAYCTLEKDGRIREANLSATGYFGVDRSALVGKPISALVAVDDRPALRNHLRRCVQDKVRVTGELRMLVPGLGPTAFQVVSTPMIDVGGAVSGCKTAITDVSQLKRSEQRLQLLADASLTLSRSFDVAQNLAEVVQSLVPFAADLCFADLFTEDGRAERVAVAVADPAKSTVAEALRRPPIPRSALTEPLLMTEGASGALTHAVGQGSDTQAIIDACGAQSVMLVPLASRKSPLGLLGFVSSSPARLYSAADLSFARDLAARAAMAADNAQLLRAAERASSTRQDILTIVSHELKNPLTGISLSADVLLRHAPDAERRKGRAQVERIKRGVAHMRHLIDDLLDFSSLESGRLTVAPRPTAVGAIIDEAIELLSPLAADKQITLEASVPTPIAASCDRHRVLQVLSNLLGNAIKFTPEGGRIKVQAVAVDSAVQLTVHDNGPGLSKQVMRHLFERYWQAKETASKGQGLGLFIAKGIVEAQGGAIWVESHPNQGTAFHFTLPPAELKPQDTADGEGRVVMVVDDDRSIRETVCDILEDRHYTVVQATNGEEALKYLKSGQTPPLLMLLDLLMPGMDGREVMAALKRDSMLSAIPVVLVSSVPNLSDEVASLGAHEALRKPIDVDQLLSLVSATSRGARG